MEDTTLVILCAGQSNRFEAKAKKQWLRLEDQPLWLALTLKLSSYIKFSKIIIVAHKDEINYMKNFSDEFEFVAGGENRQKSIKNSLEVITSNHVLITDVARACIPKDIIINILKHKNKADCIVPYLDVSDTVIYNNSAINRENVKLIQTPQLSKTDILIKALEQEKIFTDESSAIKNIDKSIFYIKGSTLSSKLTFENDLNKLSCLKSPSNDFFVGTGIDLHAFQKNKPMVLGGVTLPYDYGFKAHSDGDVLIHSLIDALLGASGAGDIGEYFPDNDEKYKNANSQDLLKQIVKFINNVAYDIVNIDITIMAEIPKINPHKVEIKNSLSTLLNIKKNKINIKATTSEKLGFIGRQEAILVQSTVTLKYYDWTKK